MPPSFFDNRKRVVHPLESKFNCTAWDILCAIEKGFRAQVDVKGKLAEWFLNLALEKEKQSGILESFTWHDEDGKPDFHLRGPEIDLRMECKNVRSGAPYENGDLKLETQKTRNQKTPEEKEQGVGEEPKPKGTRFYQVCEFDIVAACLFNQTNKWEYRFIRTIDLERHPKAKNCLKTMQRIPRTIAAPWMATLKEVLALIKKAHDAT